MTTAVATQLGAQERIIERGMGTFQAVGSALEVIRAERLYRESHATFEDYCRERWRMTRQSANRMIGASAVARNLEPIGSIPASEAQARPLANLPADEQREVWTGVVIEAERDGQPVTAARVEAAVRQYLPPNPKAADKKRRGPPSLTGWLADFRNDVERLQGAFDMADGEALSYLSAEDRRDLERTADKCWTFWNDIIEQLNAPVSIRRNEESA